MAGNFITRLFRRNIDVKQAPPAPQTPPASTSGSVAVAPAAPAMPPPAATPVVATVGGDTTNSVPVAATAVTERQCVSCGRDLTTAQAVCPSCGTAVQATVAP